MRAIRTIKRGNDMPLYGTVTRVGKNLFEVVIKFVKSKRTLHVEQIGAPNATMAKLFFRREYPTLTWGIPKVRAVIVPRTRVSKPKVKKVKLKPKKKAKRRGKAKRKDRVRR